MKTRVLLWSVISIVVFGAAASAYWWLSRPQIIVLGDGSRLALLAVTYGKHHALHNAKVGGRKYQTGTITTTNDSLCLWIDQKHGANKWPQYQLLVFDADDTGCCGHSSMTYGNFGRNNQTEQVVGIAFEAFPRRGGKVCFRAQEWNPRGGQPKMSTDRFVIHNPAPRGPVPKWTPEVLPIAKEDGDLTVTLTRFESQDSIFNNYGGPPKKNDPMRKGVLIASRVEQNGAAVTNWEPVQVETSDATGNYTKNRSWSNREENDEKVMTYQWGLWPDEPAWKLRVEMSRQSGFTAGEIWTASGIPLKPGDINSVFMTKKRGKPVAETTMGESHLEIFPAIQLSPDQVRNYGGNMDGVVQINVTPPPEGMRMNVIKITDDQNRPIEFSGWGWGGGSFRFSLKKLDDVKSINITLALHPSRYVEFTVKPSRT
jgi:hypothetical protein